MLEREGVLWTKEWRGRHDEHRSGTTQTAKDETEGGTKKEWKSKRFSMTLRADEDNNLTIQSNHEFSILEKYREDTEGGTKGKREEGHQKVKLREEERQIKRKLSRIQEICGREYNPLFHQMNGDIRNGTIHLAERNGYDQFALRYIWTW